MNLDYFVYSRGVEQNDGIKLRHAPAYINGDIINGCQALLRFAKTKGDVTEDAFEWNNTFLYLPLKDYGCSLLMRVVKIEDYETGEYISDFQRRQTWSLEGICCPHERSRYFFALLPSIVTFMKMNERNSLHTLLTVGKLGDKIELPDEMVYNPVCGALASSFQGFGKLFENKDEKVFLSAVDALANKIYNADEPFSLAFGTLAKLVFDGLGRGYRIQEFIPTIEGELNNEVMSDSFKINEIKVKANESQTQTDKRTDYALKITIKPDYKKGGFYTWSIGENNKEKAESILTSDPIPFDMEKGISVPKLLAEANCIRDMAMCLGWEVQPLASNNLNYVSTYVFTKTE